MRIIKNRFMFGFLVSVLTILALASLSIMGPTDAFAAAEDLLEITGDGVANPSTFSLDQLEDMQQTQHVYSAINTWPTKKWYVGKGVELRELLEAAGITEDASMIKFISKDGYAITLTVKELLVDKRYCFPHFKDNSTAVDGDGNIPGSAAGAELVEPMVGLQSVEGSNNPAYMNDLNTPLLMLGQRAVTEQNGNLFVKYVRKIEVLKGELPWWDAPRANPDSGLVPVGTMVALSNEHNDDDKIYYTTDGSTPTFNSPMYNWIAKRWWSARSDVLGNYNMPIGPINEDTTIRAVTIGPGKEDSDVVAFTYKVAAAGQGDEKKAVSYTDTTGHWAQEYIEALAALGAVGGYPDGSFKPEQAISRAEFATMLVKSFKLEYKGGRIFADTALHWAKDSIAAAAANGIVTGYDSNTFGPDDIITREQMAVMIYKAAQLPSVAEGPGFADNNSISPWARQAVAAVVQNKIMNGYQDNTIQPQGIANRAEAATVIIKALQK